MFSSVGSTPTKCCLTGETFLHPEGLHPAENQMVVQKTSLDPHASLCHPKTHKTTPDQTWPACRCPTFLHPAPMFQPVFPLGHGSKSRTPSEHFNPHQNRPKWVVHLPQNGTIGFDPHAVLSGPSGRAIRDEPGVHGLSLRVVEAGAKARGLGVRPPLAVHGAGPLEGLAVLRARDGGRNPGEPPGNSPKTWACLEHRWPFGEIDGASEWKNPHVNQESISVFKQTNPKGHLWS